MSQHNSSRTGIFGILSTYFNYVDIETDGNYLFNLITYHDNPHSLLCLTDALFEFNVSSLSIESDINQLKELDVISIIIMADETEPYFILQKIEDDKIRLLNAVGDTVVIELQEFTKNWSGIIVATDQSHPVSSSFAYKKLLKYLNIKSVIAAIAALLIVSCFVKLNVQSALIILVIKLLGVSVSYLLIQKDNGTLNAFTEKLCSVNKRFNCDKVIKSKGAKIGGKIKVSELSATYFCASFLMLIFCYVTGQQDTFTSLSKIIAVITSVGVAYTIFYQKFIIKHWCPLCLMLACCFVVETFVFFLSPPRPFVLSMPILMVGFIAFFATFYAFWYIGSLERKLRLFLYSRTELVRLKRNELVSDALVKSKPVLNNYYNPADITLGDTAAKHTYIEVISPFCQPCALSFKSITSLAAINNIRLIIRFAHIPIDATDEKYQVAAHMISLYHNLNEDDFLAAMLDWFDAPDIKRWIGKYRVDLKYQHTDRLIDQHNKWTHAENINHTPTHILNEYYLSKDLNVSDITYYINNFLNKNIEPTNSEQASANPGIY